MKVLVIALFASTLLGCVNVSKYQPPQNQGATIEFTMGEDGNQFYYIYPKEGCDDVPGYGQAANMLKIYGAGGKPKVQPLTSDSKVYILGVSVNRYDLGIYTERVACGKYFSFIPEEGKNYSTSFSSDIGGCRSNIVEKEFGAQPDTLIALEIPMSCSKHLK